MRWRSLCLVLLSCQTWTLVHSACHLITPSVLRADSEETFVVVLQECQKSPSQKCTVDIEIFDFPFKKYRLAQGSISVSEDKGFQGTIKLKIPSTNLEKDPKKKQFVSVLVKHENCKLEKVVLVSFQTGYIFIQTDKPIYTPGSKVMYRVFTLNPELDPVDEVLIVEFKTPENVVVLQEQVRTISATSTTNIKGILSKTYQLTEPASLGIWSVSARYEKSRSQNYTTYFEVKEYVLPTFGITLEPAKKFFHIKDEEFKVMVSATYTYGEPVSGDVFALFGVKKGDEDRSITDSLRRIQLSNSDLDVIILKKKDLVKVFPKETDMLGWKLYLSVTVITDSGSDLLEAKLEDIHIVESPYKILFTKTSTYFKPGMTFDATVSVTNPDGSPASDVPVVMDSEGKETKTRQDGTAVLYTNTGAGLTSFKITALTKDPKIASDQQASTSMMVQAYSSPNGGHLHISVQSTKIILNNDVAITFTVSDKSDLSKNTSIFYLILNTGRIVKVGRLARQGQPVMKETLTITKDLLPSFRIVAYYVVQDAIVADSIWVDVEDSCAGTLELSPYGKSDNPVQYPGSPMKLRLKADHGAHVGLVAVDRGVYILNSKYKLSQSKVWDTVEKYDTGCTPGSGANTAGVFYDAGLALHSDFKVTTDQRIDYFCKSEGEAKVIRRRRDTAILIHHKNTQASKYEGQKKTCCVDGMRTSPAGYSCERRSRLIELGEDCIKAFMDCCKYIEKKKEDEIEKSSPSDLERSDVDTDFFDTDFVVVRTEFPESWMWETKTMTEPSDEKGISSKTLEFRLKDSITTWEVLAVSVSKGKGICVSQPHNIIVMKNLFIDLKLPYSAVRNEQVEIRAVLYNYGHADFRGYVEWTHNEKFCSLSNAKKNYRQRVTVKQRSSLAVPFVIVPLEADALEVEVKVIGLISDGVMKHLNVVPEGQRIVKGETIFLDPVRKGQNGQQEELISIVNLTDIVPNTKTETIATIIGTPISDVVQDSIDGINLNNLINLPEGCGEQVMMKMSCTLLATHFLDATDQWTRVGVDRRAQAIRFLNDGESRVMRFRVNEEAAFSAFKYPPANTWLTAYVVRILSLASNLTHIDQDNVCESVKWLILGKQNPDGEFTESGEIITPGIQGGLESTEAEIDSALTAFVLIALLDSERFCSGIVTNLRGSINKAVGYILDQYEYVQDPYVVAITSYALAKAGRLQSIEKLMSASTGNKYWGDRAYGELSIEATSYAALALLKKGEYKKTVPLAHWLIEQKFHGRLYGSTQATIIMFQALIEFYKNEPVKESNELDVKINLPGRNDIKPHRITTRNAMLSRSESTKEGGALSVTAKGTGTGVLTIKTIYYAVRTGEEKECKVFHLTAKIKDFVQKRSGDAKAVASLEVCTRFNSSKDSTMAVMEISMLTGFVPHQDELKQLTKGVDRPISKIEYNGTLVLYFNKIPHEEDLCLPINLYQDFEVGHIQPASVTVYEYYAKENRCTKFYHVDEDSKLLDSICLGQVCRCADGNCHMRQQLGKQAENERYIRMCEAGVDYVYKTTVNSIEEKNNFVEYDMNITRVIKQGTDVVRENENRKFISHIKCRSAIDLQPGQDNIIWGHSKDLWKIEPEPSPKYAFLITKDTWIERWPSDRECQEKRLDICDELSELANDLQFRGCDN